MFSLSCIVFDNIYWNLQRKNKFIDQDVELKKFPHNNDAIRHTLKPGAPLTNMD